MIPNKIMTIFISVLLIIGSIYLAILSWNSIKAHNYIGLTPKQSRSISITGEGRVTGVPDIAKVQLGYSIEKKTVAEAQKDNTARMNAAVDKLKKELKIEAKDIKTINYYIAPQYDWLNGKQSLRGYSVSQDIVVKVKEMDKVSKILDMAGTIGLNQVGNLTFEIDDPEKLRQEAREKAIAQAQVKAEALAKIAKVKLGQVISFSESLTTPPLPVYEKFGVSDGLGGGAAPSVEAGSSEISITATMEYEIL